MIPLKLAASLFLGRARRAVGRFFAWATASAVHLLIVALVASLAWGWWAHHSAGAWERRAHASETARRSDAKGWASVVTTDEATIAMLTGTLRGQTATIRQWASTADRRQQAARNALAAATARGQAAQAHAAAMRASALHEASGGPCQPSRAFQDGKGEI